MLALNGAGCEPLGTLGRSQVLRKRESQAMRQILAPIPKIHSKDASKQPLLRRLPYHAQKIMDRPTLQSSSKAMTVVPGLPFARHIPKCVRDQPGVQKTPKRYARYREINATTLNNYFTIRS